MNCNVGSSNISAIKRQNEFSSLNHLRNDKMIKSSLKDNLSCILGTLLRDSRGPK